MNRGCTAVYSASVLGTKALMVFEFTTLLGLEKTPVADDPTFPIEVVGVAAEYNLPPMQKYAPSSLGLASPIAELKQFW